jgi:transcription termination factor Rho
VAAEALEQSMLESKDKDQLLAIAQALGIKTTARAAKATLIAKILETTGVGQASSAAGDDSEAPSARPKSQAGATNVAADISADADEADDDTAHDTADDSNDDTADDSNDDTADDSNDESDDSDDAEGQGEGDGESRNARRRRRRRNKNRTGEGGPAAGTPGGERQAESGQEPRERNDRPERNERGPRPERSEGSDQFALEPVQVAGYLDLRDEGYGFLRVNGYLASRDDAYIPVKLTRQYGLRKGDHVTGLSRPAGRNEKNPALLEIHTINGNDPELARNRRKFEDLTALFPDKKLVLSTANDPHNMTVRIIDLVSPIGKGQRGIIVSPPKAGKTTVMKEIATAIERHNPEVKLIVLLIDERPEEVTDMRRTVKGEVISSTFDRPSEEHTHVAELALEKAKRLVEEGHDVVIILDGITRLSRAYNLAAPPSGRILSGGIDAGALYPPKRFFGAARNCEEGGSLTILATALVETNSRMDEAIFEEFKGTGNMELRLDRRLAERRIYPAIDVDASSTRHEELLFDRKQLQQVWKLRRVLSGLADGGNAAPGLELLMDRLKTFKTNDEFLNEIGKQPTI